MGHQAFAEERVEALPGAVDELVRNDEVEGTMLFFQRANGRERQDSFDAELLESVNIGAVIDLGGHVAVPASVTRQEGDLVTF